MTKCPKCGAYIPDGGKLRLTCGYQPGKAAAEENENGPFNLFGELFEQAEKMQEPLPHDNTRWTAALGYLGPMFIYTYLKNREDEFICYHANQSCLLFVCYLAAGAADKLPVIGGIIKKLLRALVSYLAFNGARNAAQNKKTPASYVGDLGITLLK